ncbi:MAG: hypothetical protein ACAH95_04190 [Fimbriimonas sp.]
MTLALALLGLLTPEDPLDRHVTFTALPARAERLVRDLSEATKVQFLTSPVMANELLVVRAKDVSIKTLMQKIAIATSGDWQEEKGSYRLIRKPSVDLAEKNVELESEYLLWQQAIQKATEDAKKLEPLTVQSANKFVADLTQAPNTRTPDELEVAVAKRLEVVRARQPIATAAKRLTACFDPKLISSLPPGRYVFSNKPTKMQFPFPQAAQPSIRQLAEEWAIWVKALDEAPQQALASLLSMIRVTWPALKAPLPKDPILFGSFSKFTRSTDASIEWTFANENGQILDSALSTLRMPPQPVPLIPQPKEREKPLTFPPLVREMARAIRDYQAPARISPELAKHLIDPVNNDPLAVTLATGFIDYGERRNLNVVARLNDFIMFRMDLLAPYNSQEEVELTPTDFRRQLSKLIQDWTEADGWLIAKSKLPHTLRAEQIDRIAMANLLSSTARNLTTSLEEVAGFASAEEGKISFTQWQMCVRLLWPELVDINRWMSEDVLAFYGGLSPSQKNAVWSLEGLSLASLSGRERRRVDELVFFGLQPYGVQIDLQGVGGQSILREPTIAMPLGIPSEARLTGVGRESVVALAKLTKPKSGEPILPSLIGPELLAQFKYGKRSGLVLHDFDAYLPLKQQMVNLNFDLAQGITMKRVYVSFQFAYGNNYAPLINMPPAYLAAVEAERLRIQRGG